MVLVALILMALFVALLIALLVVVAGVDSFIH